MASEKQIEANRRNAQLSTGPKTEAGKAISSQNAFEHGLFAGKVLWTAGTDEMLNQIREDLVAQWQPEGPTECIFIDRMAIATYKLNGFEDLEEQWEDSMTNRNFDKRNLQLLWRRQASLERSLNTAFNNLVKFRKLRLAEQKAAASQSKAVAEPVEVAAQPKSAPAPPPAPAAAPPAPPAPPNPPVQAEPSNQPIPAPDPPDDLAPKA